MKEYRVVTINSKELNREKRISIFVPKDYEQSEEFYPVLYMHDGQSLFDDRTAYMQRSWRILEAFENNKDLPKIIIVGIESDPIFRADELIPFPFEFESGSIAGGHANEYLGFIVKRVKPYIDKTFRTFRGPKSTGIMGSSFGGVNSIYASLAYSDYFSRFGCLSNALQFDGYYLKLRDMIENASFFSVKKFYLDVGTKETEDTKRNEFYMDRNTEIYAMLKDKIDETRLCFNIIKNGIHHESSWEERFPEIIKYLFND